MKKLPEGVPVYIIPGNHETIPEDDWVALTGNSRQCTTTVGNNTFIMLDSFADCQGTESIEAPYTQADVAYIKKQMAAHPKNNVYLIGHTFPIDEYMAGESAEFRELLRDERIIGLFGGHTHLNSLVQYDKASCGNKIQAQTGNFSYTNGSYHTSFWGFRDLIITEKSAISSYIQVECDVIINGETHHYERKLTEVVDFMNPPDFSKYTAADGTVYTKLYDYIDDFTIVGVTGQLDYPARNLFDELDYTEWFPLFDSNQQAVVKWIMAEDVKVTGYVLVTGAHDIRCTPTSWKLYAGDSFSSMEEIDVRENVEMPNTTRTHSEVFLIDNPQEYGCYKLVFTGNNTGVGGYEASELILLSDK